MSQLRHKGVAAAVICSEPFVRLAKAQAAIAGVPDLPLIVIPHPLGGATQVEGQARLKAACRFNDALVGKIRAFAGKVGIGAEGIQRLRRFKDDVTEVREGYECGINLGNFQDVKVEDIIETFEMREKPRKP